MVQSDQFDLFVIGGGINGCGIARDEDALWRRSKLGLRMRAEEAAAVADWFEA